MMQRWHTLVLLYLLTLTGCGSATSAIHASRPPRPEQTRLIARPTYVTAHIEKATPARLVISAVGIDAAVESVGTLPDGDLATPTRRPWNDVGWYNAGPVPGEHGSAVIDGHLDRPGGYPAIFWDLRRLHAGDDVTVRLSNGTARHFQVTRVAYYAPQDAPIQDIFGNQGGTYLNLITCSGDWIPSQHQTTLRLVVYTKLLA